MSLFTHKHSFAPHALLDYKESLQKHQVAALSSASCSESLGWCLKVNTINSIYFTFAALFFVLSSTQRLSYPQTSLCIPTFIPVIPSSLHPSLWHSFSPTSSLFLKPVFISYPLHPSFLSSIPPYLFPSISAFSAYICLETSLSPDFSLAGCISHNLPVCVFAVVTTCWN